MTAINEKALNAVIKKYLKSSDGKGYVNEELRKIKAINVDLVTSKMIGLLQQEAREADLPESVLRHFDNLAASTPIEMTDGSTIVDIYFQDDLSRKSLYDESPDHAHNIVALFNNGYNARAYVYGYWDGHKQRFFESGIGGDLRSTFTDVWIRSKKSRSPMRFIQAAVDDFNGNYGSDLLSVAEVGDEYMD